MRIPIGYKFILGFIIVVAVVVLAPGWWSSSSVFAGNIRQSPGLCHCADPGSYPGVALFQEVFGQYQSVDRLGGVHQQGRPD